MSSPEVPTGREILRETISRVVKVVEGRSPAPDEDLLAWWRIRYGEPTYGEILDAAFPAADARRDYLATFFDRASPTETHVEIARLARRGLFRVFATTNFDHLLERALEAEGITPTVISLPEQVVGAPPRERSQAYILKLHGDYTTGKIRNSPEELEELDPPIAAELREIVQRYGLIVLGYGGGDPGVRRILLGASYRAGLYWVSRADTTVPDDLGAFASPVVADDGATFLRDLERRIDALAAQPGGRTPTAEYREVSAMLREGDIAGAERRSRRLGRTLRDVVLQTRDQLLRQPDQVPGSVSDGSKLASWRPVLAQTFDPILPALSSFVAGATAAIEQRSPVLPLFAAELRAIYESPSASGGTFIIAMPQLVVTIGLTALLARAVLLGRWVQFASLLGTQGRSTYSSDRGPIAMQAEFLHPAALADRADVALELTADFLRRDELNAELVLDEDDAAASAREANALVGVVDAARRPGEPFRPAFWGFARFNRTELLTRIASEPGSLDPLAAFVGEDAAAFRARFAERFQGELARTNAGFQWPPYMQPFGLADELAGISGRRERADGPAEQQR